MWEIIEIIGTVVVLLVVIELLNLPDWLNRIFKGTPTSKDLKGKIDSIEDRLSEVERIIKEKN